MEHNLYTYVPKDNTLQTDGLFGPAGDSEENLVRRYGERIGKYTKEDVLKWLDSTAPGRSRTISVLTEPIPDTAPEDIRAWRDSRVQVTLPSYAKLLAAGLIEPGLYLSNADGAGLETRKRMRYKPINWDVAETRPAFKQVPHYFLITKDGHIPYEYLVKQAAMSPEERTLRRLAKLHYVDHGNNSWDHIKQVYANANAMTQQIYGRPLTLSEKAAIFFHDSAVKSMGRKNHGQHARDLAVPLLLSTGYFDQQQLDDIGQAILEHDTLDNKGGPFTSTTGEVLASADTEPPDIPWMLNKMYGWHIKNTPNKADWKQGIYDSVKEYLGPDVVALQPLLYNKFHKDRRRIMKEQINSYSADELWDIVTKYRKKHHIGEDEIKYPNTTLLKAARRLYHGSPRGDLDVLSPAATKAVHEADGNIFMTPDKLLAACFLLNKQRVMDRLEKQLGKRVTSSTVGYDVWNMTPEERAEAKEIKVLVKDVPGIKPFTMKQKGYIYSADVPEDRISQYRDADPEHEVLVAGDVIPETKERITIPYRIQSAE